MQKDATVGYTAEKGKIMTEITPKKRKTRFELISPHLENLLMLPKSTTADKCYIFL